MLHPARENRYRNTVEMRQRETVLSSRPYSIQLEVTTKCNLACIMCARDKYHGRGENLEDDILDRVLEEILPTAQDIIVSSFGEPLLYPRFRDVLKRIDPDSGLQLGFFTNLLLLTPEMAEELVRSGVGYVNASIDGATKETYERIRAGGKWETLLEKIALLDAAKKRYASKTPRLNLCVVGSTLNVDETATFVEFAKLHGFDSVKYNPNLYVDDEGMEYLSLVHEQEKTVRQFRAGYRRALELDVHTNYAQKPYDVEARGPEPVASSDVPAWRVTVNRAKRLYRTGLGWRIENNTNQSGGSAAHFAQLGIRKAGNIALNMVPVYGWWRGTKHPVPHVIPNDAPPKTCGNPWTHVHVKSDGLVYPCCFSDEVMGDLRHESFEQIWNGAKYQDLRRSLSTGNYWASCRRANCNWVEGSQSSEYGCSIELREPVGEIDGAKGAELKLRVTNTGRFRWRPPLHQGIAHREFVSAAYRLFNEKLELIDEAGHIAIPHAVKPGESVEMTLPVRAVRYGGTLLLKIDMVHEGVTWFGERGNNALELRVPFVRVPFGAYLAPGNKTLFRETLGRALKPGQRFELPFLVRNVGTGPIGGESDRDFLSCHWRREDGTYAEWEGLRAPVGSMPLEPGEQRMAILPVEVPRGLEPGTYDLEFDAVREDLEWLGAAWGRPLLAWRVRVEPASSVLDEKRGPAAAAEPRGQCVAIAGNKGIW